MGILNPDFAVVVPVRDGAGVIEALHERLSTALGRGELVMVDDGSADGTWETIVRLAWERKGAPMPVRGLRLDRGRGQQAAVMAGLTRCRDRSVVTMDDDSAHPPGAVGYLLAALGNGADAAYAQPPERPGRGFRKAASLLHQRHLALLTGTSRTVRVGSFRAMAPGLVDRVLAAPMPYPYLSAQILSLRPRPIVEMVNGPAWGNGGAGRFGPAALLKMEISLARHYGPIARAFRRSGRGRASDADCSAGIIAAGWVVEETP